MKVQIYEPGSGIREQERPRPGLPPEWVEVFSDAGLPVLECLVDGNSKFSVHGHPMLGQKIPQAGTRCRMLVERCALRFVRRQ